MFSENFTTEVFIKFLRRLVRSTNSKVFLIVDRHPVHRSQRVQEWVKQHQEQLELFYLPPYCPERNPTEFLNQDVKTHGVGKQRPHDTNELMSVVRSYLHHLQKCPQQVSRYFWNQFNMRVSKC